MSSNYLISGLPSTGKTSIGSSLNSLGYATLDTDSELGYYGVIDTGAAVTKPANASREWSKDHGWVWDGKKLHLALFSHGDKPLFVVGGSRDEHKYYGLFDKIFVLHIPDDVMRSRLEARGNNYVNTPLFIDRMVEFNQTAYQHAESINAVLIETTEPIDTCIEMILAAVHGA
jgi:broad-specificity NMP kinase